jgi:hypothetical protein
MERLSIIVQKRVSSYNKVVIYTISYIKKNVKYQHKFNIYRMDR